MSEEKKATSTWMDAVKKNGPKVLKTVLSTTGSALNGVGGFLHQWADGIHLHEEEPSKPQEPSQPAQE